MPGASAASCTMPVLRAVAIAVVLMVAAAPLRGQPPESARCDTAQARAALEQLTQCYAGPLTYQDRIEMRYQAQRVDGDGNVFCESRTLNATLKFARPLRIALESEQGCLYCDGQRIIQTRGQADQYTEMPVTDDLDAVEAVLRGGVLDRHPLLPFLLLARESPQAALEQWQELTRVAEELRAGRRWRVIHGKLAPGRLFDDVSKAQLWIDADTGLLAEMRVELVAPTHRSAAGEGAGSTGEQAETRLARATLQVRFTDVRLDAPIPHDAFECAAAKKYRKVDTFAKQEGRRRLLAALRWERAPDFNEMTLDRQYLRLYESQGEAVVLYFWTSWCEPCVSALPQMQRLHERLADQRVKVIGVNCDGPGPLIRVGELLREHEVTFPQVMETGDRLTTSYRVDEFPCAIVIDKHRVIVDVLAGFSAGFETTLAESIDKVLTGTVIPVRSAKLAEYAPEAVRVSERAPVGGIACGMARQLDVDGDGRVEIVVPASGGQVHIISADGNQVTQLKLKGESGSLSKIHCTGSPESRCWFVSRESTDAPAVTCYDATGEPVWRFIPELPEKRRAEITSAAGDLDGDGSCEVVVGLDVFNLPEPGRSYYSGIDFSYLIVLDSDGRLVSQRAVSGPVALLHVAAADSDGRRAILWFAQGRMQRYYWHPVSE